MTQINFQLGKPASADELLEYFTRLIPTGKDDLEKARRLITASSREVWPYQAAALYCLANQYRQPQTNILEIGTAYGYTSAVMTLATPLAQITTLNPTQWEAEDARQSLRGYNVTVVEAKSWDYLHANQQLEHPVLYDLIFVDGDHKRVAHDMPWWTYLRAGGLFIFHDYAPEWSTRPCPPVYEELGRFARWVSREPDILIVDDHDVGMAGWYRRPTDPAIYAMEVPGTKPLTM